MRDVTTLGGAPFPEEEPLYRYEDFDVYTDGSLVFTEVGVKRWGPMFRDIGIPIHWITNVDRFSIVAMRTRSELARFVAQRAPWGEDRAVWLTLGLLFGGRDLEEAKAFKLQGEYQRANHPVEETNCPKGDCSGQGDA